MIPKKHSQLKHAMTFGAIIGMLLILYSVVAYLVDSKAIEAMGQFYTWIVLIGGMVVGIRYYRQNDMGGYISYSRALGTGVLIALFASIISGLYTYIFFEFIDSSMITKILETAEEKMIENNPKMTDQELEMAMSITRKFTTPIIMFVGTIFSTTFMGFIISLIASIFIKKKDTSFNENEINL